MTALFLVLPGISLAAMSGVFGLLGARDSAWGQRVATAFMVGAALLGLAGAGLCLLGSSASGVPEPNTVFSNLGVDALSAFFLVPIFLMSALGSIYGLSYWPQARHPSNARKLQVFWGLLTAGMALLVISKHAIPFLIGWEFMALSAFFLITTEDQHGEVRLAGWVYFIAAHIGTLTLFALFALWRVVTGSFAFQVVTSNSIGLGLLYALFFLTLFGFGLKAGLLPLHFWLPSAHTNAPSHVSAMLSGVVLKMGIYGLVRFFSLLPTPPIFWGTSILVLGGISGVLGVAFALGQHDFKRLLAYHSVENIGIILMGLGLAMLGRSTGQMNLVVLGMAGCLLHVWNHSFFKSLLFFGAGSVLQATSTRQIDLLGGLAKKMPWTAFFFLVGAVAICGLPPLNGFVSELFIYLGLFDSMTSAKVVAAVAAFVPVLAMIGALALACFVKAYGAMFLGNARTLLGVEAHESSLFMLVPMAVLAFLCVLIGMEPALFAPMLDRVIACWLPSANGANPALAPLSSFVPFHALSGFTAAFAELALVVILFVLRMSRSAPRVITWDCGYACPTSRMQYTASSFAQSLVNLFRWALRPSLFKPSLHGLFPAATEMHSHVSDLVLHRVLFPVGNYLERVFSWFRRFQLGLTQYYVLYILITLILLLLTLFSAKSFFLHLFAR